MSNLIESYRKDIVGFFPVSLTPNGYKLKVYRNADAARQHNARDHFRLPNIQIHRCSTCTRIFPNNTQLKEHISIQHLLVSVYLPLKFRWINF